jgi:membrane protein
MTLPPIRWPLYLRLFGRAVKAWHADNAPRLGAALAYYTLFAIAPVLLVAIAIAGLIFGAEAVRGEIVGQVDQLIGRDGGVAVEELLERASRPKEGRIAAALGSFTFVIAASGAFLELQSALNTIWRVKPQPGSFVRNFLGKRLRSFGLVVSIGFLMVVSLAVSAALSAVGAWLNRRAPGAPMLLLIINYLISLAVMTSLFAALYRLLPDVQLRWRDVLMGGFVTALLFAIGKELIGLYIGRSTTASTFGAAGSIVVMMIWVYYSAQIVLLGAEFTRVYTEHREGMRPPAEAGARSDPDRPTKET